MALTFAYWTLAICIVYLFFVLSQNRYRLLYPSVVHTSIWGITALIMVLQIEGMFMSKRTAESAFTYSSEYMCYIVVSSIIGFIFAHYLTQNITNSHNHDKRDIDTVTLENILTRFRWVPYSCAAIGIILLIFLISFMGDISSFRDYREIALYTERTGFMGIVQRLSGHVNVLGTFYLMLLGYKMGKERLNIKRFLIVAFMCSIINMSIGGRVWILTSSMPFFTTFALSRHYTEINRETHRSDVKKVLILVFAGICLFSIIGILRSNSDSDSQTFMDKLGYFTDGMRMTNMVLSQYPPGTYDLEYGRSEFLINWLGSPMVDKFNNSISHDIGLLVTVKSSLPVLYYDFGYLGGIVMWGIFCFILEFLCIRIKQPKTIISVLLVGQLSQMLLLSPVFTIFSYNRPYLLWILLIYLFRKPIFGNIKGCGQYI